MYSITVPPKTYHCALDTISSTSSTLITTTPSTTSHHSVTPLSRPHWNITN